MSALQIDRISLSVGNHRILDDVSLDFMSGQVTAIIGPNGAGKSSLLNVAAGNIKAHDGNVFLGGRLLRHVPLKEAARIRSVMPQDTAVAFAFTVAEVVAMGRTAWGTTPTYDRHVTAAALQQTGLAEFAEREVTTLSGGERQRVAFARVIAQATPISNNSVVLLDEPTSAMDISYAEHTLTIARNLAAQGAAVGIVLHDIDAAASYADHLVLMDHGRITTAGAVSQVCVPETLSRVYRTPIDVHTYGQRLHIGPHRSSNKPDRFVGAPAAPGRT